MTADIKDLNDCYVEKRFSLINLTLEGRTRTNREKFGEDLFELHNRDSFHLEVS